MADTFTTSLRLEMQQNGANSGTWGTIANVQYQLLEAAITGDNGYAGGTGGINIASLSTYTLTVANGTADQSRQALYPFVGALVGGCIITLPGVVKMGYVLNATTGGHNITLTVGAGSSITVTPGSGWQFFYCDGVNVTTPKFATVATTNLSATTALQVGVSTTPISATTNGWYVSTSNGALSGYSGTATPFQIGIGVPGALQAFYYGVTQVGSISTAGSSVAYNTTSDERLKMHYRMVNATDSGTVVDQLRPRWYQWKHAPNDRPEPGFFAQQVGRVYPWAVTEGVGHPGDEKFTAWQLDASKLLPVVIAELQALRARVKALEEG